MLSFIFWCFVLGCAFAIGMRFPLFALSMGFLWWLFS